MNNNILQEEIERSGLKKRHIADVIGITPKTLNDWTKYNNMTQLKNFFKLCAYLKINLADIAEEITKE